jgi:hypothetical protein
MEELLEELKKYEFIGYKFLQEYEKKFKIRWIFYIRNLFNFTYNKKLLNKKDIEHIEKSGMELYNNKKFGELLGYGKYAMKIHF